MKAWSGPSSPRMVLVGEAWGQQEFETKCPFVGSAGRELFLCLGEALPAVAPEIHAEACALHRYPGGCWVKKRDEWLEAAGIAFTNVLNLRPPGNKIEQLCGGKDEGVGWPAVSLGKYLRAEFLPEVSRLAGEIEAADPALVVALGNTASWALLQATNIGSIRGSVAYGVGAFAGRKILPTYHPAAVLRQWGWRPILVADLIKATREAAFPEIRRPRREVMVSPSLSEAAAGAARVRMEASLTHGVIANDIETARGGITCMSFAGSPDFALTIPFEDARGGSFWSTHEEELAAWELCRSLLTGPEIILGQNYLYDLQYLTRMGLFPTNVLEDTMLLHHSLWPEMQKGLGFLGSIYTNEASWKLMRRRRPDTEKREE